MQQRSGHPSALNGYTVNYGPHRSDTELNRKHNLCIFDLRSEPRTLLARRNGRSRLPSRLDHNLAAAFDPFPQPDAKSDRGMLAQSKIRQQQSRARLISA